MRAPLDEITETLTPKLHGQVSHEMRASCSETPEVGTPLLAVLEYESRITLCIRGMSYNAFAMRGGRMFTHMRYPASRSCGIGRVSHLAGYDREAPHFLALNIASTPASTASLSTRKPQLRETFHSVTSLPPGVPVPQASFTMTTSQPELYASTSVPATH